MQNYLYSGSIKNLIFEKIIMQLFYWIILVGLLRVGLPLHLFKDCILSTVPGEQLDCHPVPGEQLDCHPVLGEQLDCHPVPSEQLDCHTVPGELFDCLPVPGEQLAPRVEQCDCLGVKTFYVHPMDRRARLDFF